MTYPYELAREDSAVRVIAELAPNQSELWWRTKGAKIVAVLAILAIWYFIFGVKDSSPETLIVKPASIALETGIQSDADVAKLSDDLGFKVEVPNLSQLGVELSSVSQAKFDGQPAAVMQYQYGNSRVLLYSFSDQSPLFREMKQVDLTSVPLYLASSGAVSVVAWQDRSACFHALAAKSTEENMLHLARMVVTYL